MYGSVTTTGVQNGCVAQSLSKRGQSCTYKVKVNDQTWKCHVEQIWDSNLCPPEMETIDDCGVPEEVEHGMLPVDTETEWKDALPLAAMPIGSSPPPRTTRSPTGSKT